MNSIVAIILISGSACASPLEHAERVTVAFQVPCAVVIRQPVTNPFKIAQQPNEISTPPVNVAKSGRCNGGKVIWLKKKKNKPRRYRCA